jgi:thymidylate synthase (FAD)
MEEGNKNFDYKKRVTSCLRRIVPLGVATGGVWTGNIRALRHVIALRTTPAAEEEIAHVFTRIAEDIVKREPMLFGDFHASPDRASGWIPDNPKV